MKSRIYKLLCIALAAMLVSVIFTLGASANISFRSGGMSRSSEALAEETADENGVVHEPDTTNNDSHSGQNNSNSGNGSGSDGTAPGTGEFGDDTSNNGSMNGPSMNGNSNNNATGPVESAIDGIVTDATGAVDDAADGMGVWGIIIIIAIIAAIAVLLFSFFGRRK